MDLPAPTTTTINPLDPTHTFNATDYNSPHLHHPLISRVRQNPSTIDSLLRPYLHSPTFPDELELYIQAYTNVRATPSLYGETVRSRPDWFYANCLVYGMVLSRAFVLLSVPTSGGLPRGFNGTTIGKVEEVFPIARLPAELRLQIYDCWKEDMAQRRRYWGVISRIFIKALWSGKDPEEGARFMAGVLALMMGHTLRTSEPSLQGHGTRWIWWEDVIVDPEFTWTWEELQAGIFETKCLPRNCTSLLQLRHQYETQDYDISLSGAEAFIRWCSDNKYVSSCVLQVMDLAREHLSAGERDWSAPEMVAKFLDQMWKENSSKNARKMWVQRGLVNKEFEQRFAAEIAILEHESESDEEFLDELRAMELAMFNG